MFVKKLQKNRNLIVLLSTFFALVLIFSPNNFVNDNFNSINSVLIASADDGGGGDGGGGDGGGGDGGAGDGGGGDGGAGDGGGGDSGGGSDGGGGDNGGTDGGGGDNPGPTGNDGGDGGGGGDITPPVIPPVIPPVVPPVTPPCVTVTINGLATVNGTVGTPFTYTVTVTTGTGPVTITASGIPAGLTFSSTALTGTISGTPTTAGTFTLTVRAVNACSDISAPTTIIIAPIGSPCVPGLSVLTSATTASGTIGSGFNYQITATNNPTLFSATGLPAGLSIDTTTGVISGTPTATGTFTTTITATNNCGTVTATLTITIGGGGGGGGCTVNCGGGGGGVFPATISLTLATSAPLASVFLSQTPYAGLFLSQLPYTGVGDILLTMLYLIALTLMSVSIAYVSVYGRDYNNFQIALSKIETKFINMKDIAKKLFVAIFITREKTVIKEIIKTVFVERIVKRNVDRPVYVDRVITKEIDRPVFVEKRVEVEKLVIQKEFVTVFPKSFIEQLTERARKNGALLAEGASHIFLEMAEGNFAKAEKLLEGVIKELSVNTPENRMIVISEANARSVIFENLLSLAPEVSSWISAGEKEKAEDFLKKLNSRGFNSSIFLERILRENSTPMGPIFA